MKTTNIILIIIAVFFVGYIVWVGGSQKAPLVKPSTAELTATTTEAKKELPPKTTNTIKSMTTATITTNKGVITLELYADKAPKAVENFKKLASSGFYNGTRFHRVIRNFMIQGGDPLSKDTANINRWGTGGPGYSFADDIDPTSELYKIGYQRGVLAMANSGPNTNGSQFFIMHQDYALPPLYVIFGRVTSGLETVDAIANTKTGAQDRPVDDMIVEKVEVR